MTLTKMERQMRAIKLKVITRGPSRLREMISIRYKCTFCYCGLTYR